MTPRRPLLLWTATLGASLIALSITARAAYLARADERLERASAETLAAQLRQLADLRPMLPTWAATRRPDIGLAPRISTALAACGLPDNALKSFNADPEPVSIGGPDLPVRRQRANLLLSGLTLPQVGSLLARWRQSDPAWIITSIQLTPESSSAVLPPPAPGGSAARSGRELPLRAELSLEAVFTDAPGAHE